MNLENPVREENEMNQDTRGHLSVEDAADLSASTLDVSDIPPEMVTSIQQQLGESAAIAQAIVDGLVDPLGGNRNNGAYWLAHYTAKNQWSGE